jgi:hypothetical protein
MSQPAISKNTQPRLDPNAPAGPSGTSGCPAGPTGSSIPNCTIGGGTGASCNSNGGTVTLPNGNIVTIPYSNGWYYNITIPSPRSKKEEVKKKPKDGRDGCDCVKCNNFYPFAESNQEDGTLICFSCRNGY